MIKVPANSVDTDREALTPPVDRAINDTLIEVSPILDQTLLEMLDVTYTPDLAAPPRSCSPLG